MPIDDVICTGIAVIAAFNDLKTGKISNAIVFPVFVLGLLWCFSESGLDGLANSILGGLLPLTLLPLFIMRMLGGGDIKLLMALGSWLGFEDCTRLILLSILCGGIMAVVVMAFQRNCGFRFRKLGIYLKSCLIGRRLLPYQDFSRMEHGAALPFALAVLLGFTCLLLSKGGMIPPIIGRVGITVSITL